jgi:hypothetical protein
MKFKSIGIFLFLVSFVATGFSAEKIGYHEVKTDASGRIVPWYGTGPAQAYDHVIRLIFDFWVKMRNCPNGVPYYLQHQVWKPGEDDPRGLGGDQIPMALSSWNLLHGYLGDPVVKENMILMADYWLAHGMSKPDLLWGNLPYPYNTELHSGEYDGDMRAGKGFLQPDKAASFGAELVVLYKITENRKYLDAAVKIANTLAARIQPGDGDNSPWSYRLHAATNEVHQQTKDGKKHAGSYTSNYAGALCLFSDLIALRQGDIQKYSQAREMVTRWLKTYPLRTNKWGPFFEDIPTGDWSDTEINADTLAAYMLENPQWEPNWRQQSKRILDWSYNSFANKEYTKCGVIAINEQTVYQVPGNSHTSRHASVELLYCEKTGDFGLKEDAIRRLNWATYTVDTDGKNRYIRDDNWLTDGYGDYVRHYLRSMASAPELAPEDQNHLLRTSSVVQSIQYGADRLTYSKFDASSVEEFKIGAWKPASVTGGKLEWNAKTKVARIRSNAKTVTIQAGN